MNIYFACSITGGREFETAYQKIVAALEKDGHEIPTSHLVQSEIAEKERQLTPQDVYERDVNWIRNCDTLIAEVSTPSHGVGYEIAFALGLGKPVLCIYQKDRRVSKMLSGNPDPKITTQAYGTVEEAISQARFFLDSL
ncbi:MAG TPA: nucleoside 2-deoxyribosyltransferase [Anaerolineales bacterium]|nr:nucleoside 2-deoxyribosyltransferase [Anaerolineales bacterium]HMZ42773.1 nucleoside 2-deoxyribosyltransferase [Anaerolineales bacterium]HNA52943.1 nucleoside 2-deoxyribosyltransferase [Anaerolineales bacterium]HNB85236.1 nucleoside 2-deoxyribosyltransferase [Anaerolineales bacterium]HNC89062.1 nucleoside 2-deoxyribosyltransferase [Anaerolineales bacterium]